MAPNIKKNERGIALIITLTVITLLVSVTFELNRQMRNTVTESAISRNRMTLLHMISSGVQVAEAMLIKDRTDTEIDSVQEDWANPDKIKEYLAQTSFEDGNIDLMISDELGRIQVNALVAFPDGKDYKPAQRDFWYRFVGTLLMEQQMEETSPFKDISDPGELINPIKDWMDSGDNDTLTGLNSAESDYYEALTPSYPCRNGPFRHVDELMLVKGITPEIFKSAQDKLSGISNYITVYGAAKSDKKFVFDGKININTAELPVVAALLPIEQMFLAPEICDFRIESANDQFIHDLSNPAWYKEVPGCSDLEINPDLITNKSDIFRIQCAGVLQDTKMAATVIVQREKNEETGKWYCRVLNWSYE
ncbi:MAG: type II secretion system protein GspK [Desulfobacterales bacterium]|jgi:general secretion pathway protein K|nr:type II secretion system protein GspK [Desulfobacterales bacterium]